MKITTIALFACIYTLFATEANSQNAKVSIHAENFSLREIIREIEKQTDYLFVYDRNEVNVNQAVSLDATNESVSEVLNKIFTGTDVGYKIVGKNVTLIKNVDLSASNLIAQQSRKQITGTVTDERGEPIIGANVMEKGTTNGVITNIEGEFSLSVSENVILLISYVGFINQEVHVKNQSSLQVVLKEDTQALDEVVVVGYGTQKKINLTGAVETIKAEQITSKPVTSVAQALTGEAAGVTVIQRSSKPGAYDESIRIRGVGTWGDASPLTLVDGIEMSLTKVNPSDIESISVLKDAASASIYGSRAGNGVIIVTTKKGGQDGKPIINFSTNWGVQSITRIMDKHNALDAARLEDKRLTDDNKSSTYGDMIQKMQAGQWDPDHLLANTNWMDEIQRNALQQNHNVSISGGTKYTSYLLSLGYLNQESVIGDRTSFDRYNVRFNTQSKITDWLKIDANVAYLDTKGKDVIVGVTDIVKQAMKMESFYPVKFSDGTWVRSGLAENPVRMAFTDDYGTYRNKNSNFSGLISPEISFFGFTLKGTFAYEKDYYKADSFTKTVEYGEFTPAGESTPVQAAGITVPENKKTDDWTTFERRTSNITLNYQKEFGYHDVNVLLGASREVYENENTKSSMSGFPNNDLDAIGAGTTKPIIEGGFGYNAIASYFGRVNYSFMHKYLLEFSVRRDGSSKFSRGNRWGVFPSGSIGWRISEEQFFQPLRGFVDNLKFRGSYGKLGNNRISDYQFLSSIALNSGTGYIIGNDGNMQNMYYEYNMGNTDITWERLESTNIGLDLTVLNNRLNVTADYFNRTTKDILLTLEAPKTLGITPPMTNAAVVNNKGWELVLGWRDKIKDFKYDVSFNISDVRNKVTDLRGYKAPTNNLTILREGDPINALFGWKVLDVCRTEADYEKYKNQMSTVNGKFQVGHLIYEDLTGDGKVDGEDKTVIGNQIPRYTFGLRLGAEYKNFDFSCFFQGVGKVDGYMMYEAVDLLLSADNTFSVQNPNTEFPKLNDPSINTNTHYNSFWVEDASYVRLKNIQLGYTFTQLQKYNVKNLRVFFSGENLATFTKYRGYDPESPVGMRGWMYPLVGVYSFGLNLTF